MLKINLFIKKGEYFNLSSGQTGELRMVNVPAYNIDIKLWKGIDNKIEFSVRDHDRKSYPMRDKELFLTIINSKLNTKLVKKLWCKDAYKGIFETTILEKELRDFEPTYYQASVVAKDLNNEEDMLYTGVDWNPIFTIYIEEGFRDVFKPSIELDPSTFLHNFSNAKDGRYDYYVSSMIKADETDSHTASITVKDNFLGKIIMEGSCEENPLTSSDSDWFEIDSKEYTDENKVEAETFQFNKQLNCMWVRFKYIVKSANEGKITEILYRN